MKKTTFLFITLLAFVGVLPACSSFQKGPTEITEKEKSEEQSGPLGVEEAMKRLNKLADEAKQVGEHAVNYLASDLYMKASAASMQGDAGSALILYKFLITLKPEDSFLKFKYAVELIKVGKLDEAKPVMEDIFKKSGHKDEKVGLVLGGLYTALKEQKNARKTYELIYSKNNKSEDACVFLAKSYVMDKEMERAKAILSKCENQIKENGIFSFYKGKISLEQNRLAEAEKHFYHSLKVDKEYYQSAVALGHIFEGKQNLPLAVKTYRQFLERSPENPVVISRLVQVLFMQENYREVVPFLEKLLRLDPENNNVKIKLGILYTDTKEYDKAKAIFNELLEANPQDDKVLYYLGALHQDTNEFEAAMSYYGKVSKEGPLYTDSILQVANLKSSIAQVYGKKDEQDHVAQFFDFVNEKMSENPAMKIELSVVKASYFESQQQVDKATDTMLELKDEAEFNDTHKYYLATLMEKQKRHTEANELIWAIIKKDPQNAHTWNFLGYSLLERNQDLSKAYEYITKAVKLKPNDGFIRDSLGWYYYKQGKHDLALKELKKARELVADDVAISKHLAEIYHAQKNYDLAKKYYMEALKNSKMESDRQDVLKSMEKLDQIRRPAAD